jgi:ABC-type branched-subunit amino acid transport system ATPase component
VRESKATWTTILSVEQNVRVTLKLSNRGYALETHRLMA